MTRPMVRCALLTAVVLIVRPLGAQALVGVTTSDTVRVVGHGAVRELRGVFVAIRDDSVFVRRYSATFGYPVSRVDRIDVLRRRSVLAGIGRGVAIGAPVGLASGFLLGSALAGPREDFPIPVMLGAAGLAAGTGLGVIFGGAIPGKRWEQVSMRPSMAVGPARGGGVALGLNLRL